MLNVDGLHGDRWLRRPRSHASLVSRGLIKPVAFGIADAAHAEVHAAAAVTWCQE
jgi:hypothetical protein